MSENFQLSGNTPAERDMLKIAVIMGVIEGAVSFNMRAEILSSPIALLASSEQIKPHIFLWSARYFQGKEKVALAELSQEV